MSCSDMLTAWSDTVRSQLSVKWSQRLHVAALSCEANQLREKGPVLSAGLTHECSPMFTQLLSVQCCPAQGIAAMPH